MTSNITTLANIPIDKIIVDSRARKDLGDIESLRKSIRKSGLISPLAVQKLPDGNYKLLAGERRLTVLRMENVSTIPVRVYERKLSSLEAKVIEKAENFYRKDFEWHELDALTAEIHSLQQQKEGKAPDGPRTAEGGWSMADTAQMLGVSKPTVSAAIKRHEMFEKCPEMFEKCKTASEAQKVMKKVQEEMIKSELARALQSDSKNLDAKIKKLASSYIIGNVFEKLKEIPDGVFHIVEIDPPYAIDLKNTKYKKHSESQYNYDCYGEVSKSIYLEGSNDPTSTWHGLKNLFKECYRVMSSHGWLLCWFAPEPWFEKVYEALVEAGFTTNRLVGVWVKSGGSQSCRPENHLSNSYEPFFWARKGSPALNEPGHPNVFYANTLPPAKKIHPTERPIELMEQIYRTFAFPGSRILIPFLGSGNGIIAAHNCGLQPIGFELSKTYRDAFLVKLSAIYGRGNE